MYVAPSERGRGLGRELLEALEGQARLLGYSGVVLETGELQQESLGLYLSAGYEPIPCYGVYAARSWSRCFEKTFCDVNGRNQVALQPGCSRSGRCLLEEQLPA